MKHSKSCPRTPGQRHYIQSKNSDLESRTENKPLRSLSTGKKRTSGRNNYGRITTRHRGGGHKRRLRLLDFRRDKLDIPAKVASVEYDPNRSANIVLLHYLDGEKRYIVAPQGVKVGQELVSSNKRVDIKAGNAMPLKELPLGTQVHCIELKPNEGAKMIRSAGTMATYVARDLGYATLKLRSGEIRKVRDDCRATVGVVGNSDHYSRKLGKAGRTRWLGFRPTVRGTAMNPVDHPHGGGEGKNAGGIPRTPKGLPTLGRKTRKKNKSTNKLIVKRKTK